MNNLLLNFVLLSEKILCDLPNLEYIFTMQACTTLSAFLVNNAMHYV